MANSVDSDQTVLSGGLIGGLVWSGSILFVHTCLSKNLVFMEISILFILENVF